MAQVSQSIKLSSGGVVLYAAIALDAGMKVAGTVNLGHPRMALQGQRGTVNLITRALQTAIAKI